MILLSSSFNDVFWIYFDYDISFDCPTMISPHNPLKIC